MKFNNIDKSQLLTEIEIFIARVLSLQNSNPFSKHYGCFDRNFWHFKTIIDFPSATYQQVVLGFSYLYNSNIKTNKFYKSEKLKEVIKSAILYWCKIQNNDGSQNEYYENDRSFCPTALTTFAISQSYLILPKIFNEKEKKLIISKLIKAGNWLSKHEYHSVQNQMIASMIALNNIWKITKKNKFKTSFNKQKKEILIKQNNEGWFTEYGGADIGYSFIQLDFLCHYLELNKDKEILEASKKLIIFVSNFIHPDGTAGGSYGSRCTQHVMPFPIIYLANKEIIEAGEILKWYIKNKKIGRIINQNLIDNKYASYFYFNSYIKFFIENQKYKKKLKSNKIFKDIIVDYKNSGLLVIKRDFLSIWLNWKKNGIINIYMKDKKIFSDNGYLFQLSNDKIGMTQNHNNQSKIDIKNYKNNIKIIINGQGGYFNEIMPLEKWIVPFKIFSKYFLKINFLSYWFNKKIKKNLVQKQEKSPVFLKRTIDIHSKNIIIKDEINIFKSNLNFKKIIMAKEVTTTHSPSSRFYQPQNIIENYHSYKVVKSNNKYSFKHNIDLKC